MPPVGERTERDRRLLAEVEAGFETVGEPLGRTRFKAAITEAMRLAALVNQYLAEEQPWQLVKRDQDRAGTVLNVALQCVNQLKVMLTPFLPFSSQRLHEMLGFDDVIAPMPEVREYTEPEGDSHRVLTGDYEVRDRWHPEELPAGQVLREPKPLYRKLDPKVVEEELARMEAGAPV